MKLFNDNLHLPPLPPAPPPPDEPPEETTVPAVKKGRPAAALPDERIHDFAQYLRDKGSSPMTVGSYTSAVFAMLSRGVASDAPE